MGMTLAEEAKFKKLQRQVAKLEVRLDKFENNFTNKLADAVQRVFDQFEVQPVDEFQKTKDYLLSEGKDK